MTKEVDLYTSNIVGHYFYTVTGLLGSGIAGLALQWITQPTAIVVFFCTHIMLAGICVSVTNGAVVDLIPTHLRYELKMQATGFVLCC